jgi:hypothetical protein
VTVRVGLHWPFLFLLIIAAGCSDRAAVSADTTAVPASSAPERWEFGGSVPESLTTPVPEAGVVVSRFEGADQTVVMLRYDGARQGELLDFYDRWAETGEFSVEAADEVIIAETQAIWARRWSSSAVEVRLTQCLDPATNDFTQLCVAVTERSAP